MTERKRYGLFDDVSFRSGSLSALVFLLGTIGRYGIHVQREPADAMWGDAGQVVRPLSSRFLIRGVRRGRAHAGVRTNTDDQGWRFCAV